MPGSRLLLWQVTLPIMIIIILLAEYRSKQVGKRLDSIDRRLDAIDDILDRIDRATAAGVVTNGVLRSPRHAL